MCCKPLQLKHHYLRSGLCDKCFYSCENERAPPALLEASGRPAAGARDEAARLAAPPPQRAEGGEAQRDEARRAAARQLASERSAAIGRGRWGKFAFVSKLRGRRRRPRGPVSELRAEAIGLPRESHPPPPATSAE